MHIDDISDAYCKAINYNKTNFEVFNIGSGKSYSVNEIATTLKSLFNNKIEIIYSNEIRKNEVLVTVANISKANHLLNWHPKISLLEGLNSIV